MTNEELNARFAAVADLLSDFAGEHDIALKRLEEAIDELRNEQRQTNRNLDELREEVRNVARQTSSNLDDLQGEVRNVARQTSSNLDDLRGIVRTAVRAGVRERRERHLAEKELRVQLLETEQRNEQRLTRMETAIERLAELMADRNGKKS